MSCLGCRWYLFLDRLSGLLNKMLGLCLWKSGYFGSLKALWLLDNNLSAQFSGNNIIIFFFFLAFINKLSITCLNASKLFISSVFYDTVIKLVFCLYEILKFYIYFYSLLMIRVNNGAGQASLFQETKTWSGFQSKLYLYL